MTNDRGRLSIEQFKKVTGMDGITDENAEEMIESIAVLVDILMEYEAAGGELLSHDADEYLLKQAA